QPVIQLVRIFRWHIPYPVKISPAIYERHTWFSGCHIRALRKVFSGPFAHFEKVYPVGRKPIQQITFQIVAQSLGGVRYFLDGSPSIGKEKYPQNDHPNYDQPWPVVFDKIVNSKKKVNQH